MNSLKRILGTFAVLALLGISLHGNTQQLSEAEYQQKLKQLEQSIGQLKKELKKAKSTRDSLQNELETSEVDIGGLVKDIERLKEALASGKKQITQLGSERAQLQRQQQQQKQLVEQNINAMYRLDTDSNIKLALNQQNPEELTRKLRYYEYVVAASTRSIEHYLTLVKDIEAVEQRLNRENIDLQNRQNALTSKHQKLVEAQSKRSDTLRQLVAQIKNQGSELDQKVQDQKRLQELLESLVEAINDLNIPGSGKPIRSLKGKLSLPTKGKLLNSFGSKRSGQQLKWDGINIAAKEGSPVEAIHHGRVVFADYLRGQGLLLILDHGDGYFSLYAHNRALLAELGEWVNTGDTIAQVGSTGGKNTSALYFEIRHNGKPVDPILWCKRR